MIFYFHPYLPGVSWSDLTTTCFKWVGSTSWGIAPRTKSPTVTRCKWSATLNGSIVATNCVATCRCCKTCRKATGASWKDVKGVFFMVNVGEYTIHIYTWTLWLYGIRKMNNYNIYTSFWDQNRPCDMMISYPVNIVPTNLIWWLVIKFTQMVTPIIPFKSKWVISPNYWQCKSLFVVSLIFVELKDWCFWILSE